MSQVIDVRAAGGDLVILGDALTLPHSSRLLLVGDIEPLVGSVRYNSTIAANDPAAAPLNSNGPLEVGRLQAYLPQGNDWLWENIATDRANSKVLYSTGATMTGNLRMYGGRILLDPGTIDEPSLTFDPQRGRGTGLSLDSDGNLIVSSQTEHTLTVKPKELHVHDDLYAQRIFAHEITANVGNFAQANIQLALIDRAEIESLWANVGHVVTLTANQIDVIPPAGSGDDLISEIILTTQGLDWKIAHDALGHLNFDWENSTRATLFNNGTFRANRFQSDIWMLGDDWEFVEDTLRLDLNYSGQTVWTAHSNGATQAGTFYSQTTHANDIRSVSGRFSGHLRGNTAQFTGELQAQSIVVSQFSATTLQAYSALRIGSDWSAVPVGQDIELRFMGGTKQVLHANGAISADEFITTGADVAERYHADAVYEPGTVLVIGGAQEVTACTKENDRTVAGVVSTAPGMKLNTAAGDDATHPYVALKGRIPCKVVGPIEKGDVLITSAYTGHAKAGGPNTPAANIIGKALQSWMGGAGVIEIMVR